MTKIKLALLGAGLIGREHASLISNHSDAELVGIADASPLSRNFAQQFNVPHFEDFERLLDAVNPDGAVIALPNHLHLPAALACIQRGIVPLVEKPIADTIQSARLIVDTSVAADVPVLIGHHRRHSPDIREARRIVQDGELGQVVAINGMCMFDKPDDYFAASWRRKEGGGPLLINLIHDIDALRFICGEIESVRAFTSNAVRGFEVEDTASVVMRFKNGVLGTFILSDAVVSPWAWEFTSGQALYFPHQPGAYLFIGGRRASLSISDMTVWRHADDAQHWQHPVVGETRLLDTTKAYANQLDHFLQVVRREAEPIISAQDGLMTLAATLAIGLAAREDRTVTVSEIAG